MEGNQRASESERRSSGSNTVAKSAPPVSSAHLRVPPPSSLGAYSRKSADWSVNPQSNLRPDLVYGNRRPQIERTIVIVGSTRVGKSAIVNQFLHGIFQEEYKPTVDDLHWIQYDAASANVRPAVPASTKAARRKQKDGSHQNTDSSIVVFMLRIMDMSGSRDFLAMRKHYEKQGDAFVLVISVDDPDSFEEAKLIRSEIGERNEKNAPVIVVLNKIDLREQPNSECRVCAEEVREFALSSNSLFIEATATKYESVTDIFQQLLEHHSSIPPTAQLTYRRKSMPVSTSIQDFTTLKGTAAADAISCTRSRSKIGIFSDHSRDIPEEEDTEQTQKKGQSCVVS